MENFKLNSKGIRYEFSSHLWRYNVSASWHFISLPIELSKEIRLQLKWQEEGWGRLKALAKIGGSEWQTAIWFDTKMKTYLLPVKAIIRKKESIQNGDLVKVELWL